MTCSSSVVESAPRAVRSLEAAACCGDKKTQIHLKTFSFRNMKSRASALQLCRLLIVFVMDQVLTQGVVMKLHPSSIHLLLLVHHHSQNDPVSYRREESTALANVEVYWGKFRAASNFALHSTQNVITPCSAHFPLLQRFRSIALQHVCNVANI